jgi:hypothetical protein
VCYNVLVFSLTLKLQAACSSEAFPTTRIKSSQSTVSSTVDVLLLPDSRPCRLATISHQPRTPLAAVSKLLRNQVKVKVTLRLTVSQSVSLDVEPHLGLMTNACYSFSLMILFCGAPSLTRGRGCLLYMLLDPRQHSLSRVRVSWDS